MSNDAGRPAGRSASASARHETVTEPSTLDERAARDDPAAAPVGAARPEHAHLFLVRQHDLELEPLVREKRRDAHELGEDVLEPARLRRPPRREHDAVVGDAHDPPRHGDRRDEPDAMRAQELLELPPERREAAGLDLDQEVAADEVDDVGADRLLDAVAAAGGTTPSAGRGARPRSASRSPRRVLRGAAPGL